MSILAGVIAAAVALGLILRTGDSDIDEFPTWFVPTLAGLAAWWITERLFGW